MEYEIEESTGGVAWGWLILIAIILWSGAWWLGSQTNQSQGKTSTPQIK